MFVMLLFIIAITTSNIYAQNFGVQKLTLKLKMLITSATNSNGTMTVPVNYPRTLGDPLLFEPASNHVDIGNYKNYEIDQTLRVNRNFVSVVLVELRGTAVGNDKSPFTIGWVDTYGNIYNWFGEDLTITKPRHGNYYIAAHVPNSFPVMTPIALQVSGEASQTLTWDFSTSQNQCYGGDQLEIPGTSPTKWGSIAGEYLTDGAIDVSDLAEVYNQIGHVGFSKVDFNNDNVVDLIHDVAYVLPLENRQSKILYWSTQIQPFGEDNIGLTAYPNPFNPTTVISYTITNPGIVKLNVYDILGKQITQLTNEFKTAGSYSVRFNASELNSGAYYIKSEIGGQTNIRKVMLVK